MESLINGWWIGGYYDIIKKYNPKSDRTTAVKFCPKCSKCWQFAEYIGGSTKNRSRLIEYLVDFPSYGLNKTSCRKCKKKGTL